jgi:hypothetical protein
MALLIAAAALAGIVWGVLANQKLEARLRALEVAQASLESTNAGLKINVQRLLSSVTNLSGQEVDLMNSNLQHLLYGLGVSELTIARQDSGVRVAGRMVNGSTIRYRDATFRVKVGNVSKEFAIGILAPGSSGAFDVVLPNLPLENARLATFSFTGASAVEYAR